MPHCIVEHSETFESDLLVHRVFSGALNSGLFEADGSDIKVRASSYSSYLIGQKKTDFIHVALKILAGRTHEQKSLLSNTILGELVALDFKDTSITVEVVDIDRDSYCKVVKLT